MGYLGSIFLPGKRRAGRVRENGQALITLLFFVIIGITVTTSAIIIIGVDILSGTKLQQSTIAYEVAESGADNALLRLLRDPTYTGETMNIGTNTATITVTGSGPYTIVSTGTVGNFTRKIQIVATYNDNLLTVTSRQEVF